MEFSKVSTQELHDRLAQVSAELSEQLGFDAWMQKLGEDAEIRVELQRREEQEGG